MMVSNPFLMPGNLPVQFIGHGVNGSVHVGSVARGVNPMPGNVNGHLSKVFGFLNVQHHVGTRYMIVMPGNTADFLIDMVPQGVRDLKMLASNNYVHENLLCHRS
tara:strand:+ start:951 stop:1265 length:315 start_codon:yes stop_codon:yes gene_type:complete